MTTWIGEHLIVFLAASSLLFGQDKIPDARQIVASSIAVTQRSWQGRLQYTYVERDEDRRLDSDGRLKSEEVDLSRMIPINGVPFEQLVERNGQPPPAMEQRKQQEKLEKSQRETPEERAERLSKEQEETASLVREIPKAFDFQLVGEEVVDGRPAYVLQATPTPANKRKASTARCSPSWKASCGSTSKTSGGSRPTGG